MGARDAEIVLLGGLAVGLALFALNAHAEAGGESTLKGDVDGIVKRLDSKPVADPRIEALRTRSCERELAEQMKEQKRIYGKVLNSLQPYLNKHSVLDFAKILGKAKMAQLKGIASDLVEARNLLALTPQDRPEHSQLETRISELRTQVIALVKKAEPQLLAKFSVFKAEFAESRLSIDVFLLEDWLGASTVVLASDKEAPEVKKKQFEIETRWNLLDPKAPQKTEIVRFNKDGSERGRLSGRLAEDSQFLESQAKEELSKSCVEHFAQVDEMSKQMTKQMRPSGERVVPVPAVAGRDEAPAKPSEQQQPAAPDLLAPYPADAAK